MLKVPLARPQPDAARFARVIRGEVAPATPPLAELFLDYEIVRDISTHLLGRRWVKPEPGNREAEAAFLCNWLEVYHRMGYDSVRIGGGLTFTGKVRPAADTAGLSKGTRNWTEQGTGPIASWDDFERYPWPDPAALDHFAVEFVSTHLPDGMGLFLCPSSGILEIPLDCLLGYENLSYLLYDDPKLVAAVFDRVGELIYAYYRNLAGVPGLLGFFQGDDMGFKTGTLIGPDHLRQFVLPWHRKIAALAHERGLLYLLHSCGNLEPIMEDLIEDVKIDARHSFEDEGNSVLDFKRRYGSRVAVLGGIDLNRLCLLSEPEVRRHVRSVLDVCVPGGRYALGSGNSVANYVPVANYLAMVEEGLNYGRG